MSFFNKNFTDKKNNKRNNSFKDFYNNIIFNNEKFNKNNNNNIFKNSDNKKFNFNIFFNNNNKHNLNRPFTQNLNDKFNVKKNYFSNNNNNNFYSTLFHFPSSNNSFFENKKIEDDYLKLTNNFENNIINKKDTKNHFDINNFIMNTENNENNIENNNKNNNNNKENNVNNNINNNNDNNNINIENNNNSNINSNNNTNNNINSNINNNNNNFINNNNILNNNTKNTKNDFLKNNLFRPYKSKIPIAQNFNTYLYKTNLSYRNYINSNNKMYNSYLTKQNIKNNLTTFFKNNNSTLTPNISTLTHNDFNININNNNKQKNNKISSYTTKSTIKNITKNTNFKINYSSLSKAGCSIAGIPKTNQDNFYTQSSKITNSYFEYTFGVFDGHGSEGHLVSQTLKSFFEIQPFTNLNSKENLKSTFNQLSNCINNTKNINFFISGSTCVLVHISNKKIICGNVGDSRAIIFYDMNNNLIIKNLSFDHKPENFEEKKRIEKMGGRVERIYNEIGPFRVWFKNENFPGLAMSRSFGDQAAHSVGVIDEPDIIEMDVVEDEGKAVCVIVASDGVWEFVGNESLKEIVQKYVLTKNAKDCVNDIVQKSRKMWEKSGFAIDDITCVVGFFEYDDDINVNDDNNNDKFNINEEKNI